MNTAKQRVHFADRALTAPVNPVTVNLIGAGGTGSQVLTGLIKINHALTTLGHAGLQVRLWDDDVVTEANLGRQLFATSEIGLHKSVTLINRTNRFFGYHWKAETEKFRNTIAGKLPEHAKSTLYISCVDSVAARFEVADMLRRMAGANLYNNAPKYWLDFGNSQCTGQVWLSTVSTIKQPSSEKFEPIADLPFITETYGDLLKQSEESDPTPSCSLAEALEKQDLFINPSLAQMGCSLLWNLFRNGMTENKGFFHNLETFVTQPIKV